VSWGKVVVELSSHDVGGITARDFRLAAALDQL
jgi:pterin-4a-carbinolamine dehydratase